MKMNLETEAYAVVDIYNMLIDNVTGSHENLDREACMLLYIRDRIEEMKSLIPEEIKNLKKTKKLEDENYYKIYSLEHVLSILNKI